MSDKRDNHRPLLKTLMGPLPENKRIENDDLVDEDAGHRRIEDVICEFYDGFFEVDQIYDELNLYQNGERVRDEHGNVLPEITIEFIKQVIAARFP